MNPRRFISVRVPATWRDSRTFALLACLMICFCPLCISNRLSLAQDRVRCLTEKDPFQCGGTVSHKKQKSLSNEETLFNHKLERLRKRMPGHLMRHQVTLRTLSSNSFLMQTKYTRIKVLAICLWDWREIIRWSNLNQYTTEVRQSKALSFLSFSILRFSMRFLWGCEECSCRLK